jgi:hypothetical protein
LHREDAQDAQGIRMWKKEEIGVVVVGCNACVKK